MALRKTTDWIFDLDNTLYQGTADFFGQIDKRMTEFISRYLNLTAEDARFVQKTYLAQYGTSLSGLMERHQMDPADFLDFVHDVDLAPLSPNPALAELIADLPGRKFIFTNASRGHAQNVGQHLGLYDLFDGVFAIEDTAYIPKPQREAYETFVSAFDIDTQNAVMFEDSVRNLAVPKAMGMATVLVTSDIDWHSVSTQSEAKPTTPPDWVDHQTRDLTGWLSIHT